MSTWIILAKAATVLNVVLLLGLGYIWGRNYLTFRSKHTLGLLVFALFLVLENGLVLFYYLVDPTLSAWWHDQSNVPLLVWRTQMAINLAQTVGLSFLLWISLD
ncbi:hypothetical protein EL22_20025 [Halostagnicola sp. A56]|uniref:hypothetical protein n=1 Tax=Halostagnicola sp. A56 TaxID=1495067 RepID=UPI00049EA27B|nr:hypothetical protein [Halostagnicola sp. A56]KDE56814.1 hypothetical protein EL22_20025 [Halostagnicola sp. A56]